jgi:hypothetical protein
MQRSLIGLNVRLFELLRSGIPGRHVLWPHAARLHNCHLFNIGYIRLLNGNPVDIRIAIFHAASANVHSVPVFSHAWHRTNKLLTFQLGKPSKV